MTTEFEFIARIRDLAASQSNPDLVLGIGDDAATFREQTGRETVITVDLLVEDVDFKLDYAPPRWLGHKSLAVSLSDIAAMGAAPCYSLLTLAIPKILRIPDSGFPNFWEEFFAGYFELARKRGVALIGGDISSSPDRLTIDSIVLGHCAAGKAVRRSGARIGDGVYLTGEIGASVAGLKLLLNGARVNETEDSLLQSALRAHLKPEPRNEFGRRIGESGLARAMIDVSDGLAQDLAHICEESRVSALLDYHSIPIAGELTLVTSNADQAFSLAAAGGEDYELLFTADRKDEARLFEIAAECALPLTLIGEIAPAGVAAILLNKHGRIEPLEIKGYDHFGSNPSFDAHPSVT